MPAKSYTLETLVNLCDDLVALGPGGTQSFEDVAHLMVKTEGGESHRITLAYNSTDSVEEAISALDVRFRDVGVNVGELHLTHGELGVIRRANEPTKLLLAEVCKPGENLVLTPYDENRGRIQRAEPPPQAKLTAEELEEMNEIVVVQVLFPHVCSLWHHCSLL